ncbi:MAG TPA: hypothetical protein VF708_03530 [Pyrinomonadaceae bacterium]|jgi:hypothetical protein
MDFSSNDFDRHARDTQLQEGESISGWMFFELDPKIRALDYDIKQIDLTIEDTVRDSETISLISPNDKATDYQSTLSSGEWNILGGYYDLTKEHYTLTPMIDLKDVLKRKGK